MGRPLKADVVIVGAGAAGSTYAALLAEAGKRVIVLESGPARKEADLISSQIWARRLKWAEPHLESTGPNSISFNFNAGRGFGGASVHHYGNWPRLHAEDFEEHSRYGVSRDWPISYDDIRPYYDRVQTFVGVAGDAEAEVWRPEGAPYPLPPVLQTYYGDTLQAGFDAMGLKTAPSAAAVLTEPYNGRDACIWDGWCDAGCPIGALGNPLVTYIPRARASGVTFLAGYHVTRVLTSADGKRATGVAFTTATGSPGTVEADMVILAAFVVENARLLLNSATDAAPNGLANGTDQVGRRVMTHPAVNVFGMFDDDIGNFVGLTGGQLMCQDAYGKLDDDGAYRGSRQWLIALAMKPNDLLGVAMSRPDISGEALHSFMKKAARGLGAMVSVGQDQPNPDNRITLSDTRDAFGQRRASVHYTVSEQGRALFETSVEEGVAIMKAAGAQDAWAGPLVAMHVMGGTTMGDDPATSVANRYGQTHEIPNLVLGGTGLYPTSGAVNPTFTLHALAEMSADHLIANWQAITAA